MLSAELNQQSELCGPKERSPAVFLDRDGTLIEDRGHLRSPSEVVFFPDTVPALARLQEHFRLFIVTHQSGIAKGIVDADEVARVNDFVVAELRRHGIVVSAVYCCQHNREDGCACVKPKPQLLHKAAASHGVSLVDSFTVGDHPHDVAFGANAGATGIYVLTGHGAKHRRELPPGRAVVPGIREAAEWILAAHAMKRQEAEDPCLRDRAAGILRNGGIVAFPTETVYGLGAVVFDEQAVARVFEVKQRPRFDPLIVHVSTPEQLPQLVEKIPRAAEALIERFWPGPLTLVLPKKRAVPDLVTAGLPSVAVRMPRHPVALDLIDRTGIPIAAPSANPFGYVSPTTAKHVRQHLGNLIDMVLDGGACTVGLESTVLALSGPQPVLLRAGGIASEEIEQVIGNRVEWATGPDSAASPGQTRSHYSPKTPFMLGAERNELPADARVGLLRFGRNGDTAGFAVVEDISPEGDIREAGIKLFAAIHRLDDMDLDVIVADPVPESGLGVAVMDRLRRASQQAQPEFSENRCHKTQTGGTRL